MRRQRFFKETDDNEKCNFTAQEKLNVTKFSFFHILTVAEKHFRSSKKTLLCYSTLIISLSCMTPIIIINISTHIVKNQRNNQREMIISIHQGVKQFFFRPNRLYVNSDSFLPHRKRDKAQSSHIKAAAFTCNLYQANANLQQQAVQKLYEKACTKNFGKTNKLQ